MTAQLEQDAPPDGPATVPAQWPLPTLLLEHVTVRYGDTAALDGVTLVVAPGERVGLVGPSGAGKTTLLRLFNGSVRPAAGRAVVLGDDVATLSGRNLRRLRSRVGFVHQDLSLVPNQRVIRNVLAGKLGRGPARRSPHDAPAHPRRDY